MKVNKRTLFKGTGREITVWKNEKGEAHREDGPARIWKDGHKEWWLNGYPYNEKDYKHRMYKRNLIKLNETN